MTLAITPSTLGGLRVTRVIEKEPHFNMLVYGKAGVGKTMLAGSAYGVREMQRVLLVDIEGGALTLRKPYPNIEQVRVESWSDMQKVYDALFAGGHGYKTVILDSVTEIQKMNMDSIMRALVEKADERDMDVPSLREWGKNLEQTRRFVRAFRDLPMNVIFTALVREDKDRMGRPVNLPSLSGKMAGEVSAFLDIVLYYSIKEIQGEKGPEQVRVLQSAATESTIAKDRSGLLPSVMLSPTMEKLYDIIIRKTGGTFVSKEETAKVLNAPEVKTESEPKQGLAPVTDEELALMNQGADQK